MIKSNGKNTVAVFVTDGEISSEPTEIIINYDNTAPQFTFEYEFFNGLEEATGYASATVDAANNGNVANGDSEYYGDTYYLGADETEEIDDEFNEFFEDVADVEDDESVEVTPENIEIDEPDPNQKYEYIDFTNVEYPESADRVSLFGTVNKYAIVYINGEEVNVECSEDGTCIYWSEMQPERGVNMIKVKFADMFGNVAEQTFIVNY